MKLMDLPYSIYVLLFGVYVSMRIASEHFDTREKRFFVFFSTVMLSLQGAMVRHFSESAVRLGYPLIVHLPIVLVLWLRMKADWRLSIVSVLITYALCQPLRWMGLALALLPLAPALRTLLHIAACHALLMILDRWCLTAVHRIAVAKGMTVWMGLLPGLYYAYEYFMLFTHSRFSQMLVFSELLSTAMVLFFLLFMLIYHNEAERRQQAERQSLELERELTQAGQEIGLLRTLEEQTAIYRHDLRHHLTLIHGLLSSGQTEQAAGYILQTEAGLDAITPQRFCENETVNLLLRTFQSRADKTGVTMQIKAALPKALPISDSALCALLSNALENALHAASKTQNRTVSVLCKIRQNHLLIEIKNPYQGTVIIKDSLPVPHDNQPHYGCRSIQAIVQKHSGVCTFTAENGLFSLRIAIPVSR